MDEDKGMAPLQLLAIGFDKPNFEGRIAKEIQALRDKNFIRIVDAIVIRKDRNGNIHSGELSDLVPGEAARYGAIIGTLIGLGTGDERLTEETAKTVSESFDRRYQFGLDKEDVQELAEDIPTGGAAVLLLLEHRWAKPLKNAFRQAGGSLLAQDFLSPEALMNLGRAMYSGVKA